MNLFKSRLIDTGKCILAIVAAFLIVIIIIGVLAAFLWLLEWIWAPLDDIIVIGGVVGLLLFFIGKGLYWLFIEPIIKAKKEREIKKAYQEAQDRVTIHLTALNGIRVRDESDAREDN